MKQVNKNSKICLKIKIIKDNLKDNTNAEVKANKILKKVTPLLSY